MGASMFLLRFLSPTAPCSPRPRPLPNMLFSVELRLSYRTLMCVNLISTGCSMCTEMFPAVIPCLRVLSLELSLFCPLSLSHSPSPKPLSTLRVCQSRLPRYPKFYDSRTCPFFLSISLPMMFPRLLSPLSRTPRVRGCRWSVGLQCESTRSEERCPCPFRTSPDLVAPSEAGMQSHTISVAPSLGS